MKYLEDCIEENPRLDIKNLLQDITDSKMISSIRLQTPETEELIRIQEFEKYNDTSDKVVYNYYDPIKGPCVTVDISPLIGGMVKVKQANTGKKTTLMITVKNTWGKGNIQGFTGYLHNETDVYGLHSNMPYESVNWLHGNYMEVEKIFINSLPTKTYSCTKSHLNTCLRNTFVEDLRREANCYIPFLSYDKGYDICPNDVILKTIKTWQYYLRTHQDYKSCKNLKPCVDVVYKIVSNGMDNYNRGYLQISFQNEFVQTITDSYSYTGTVPPK